MDDLQKLITTGKVTRAMTINGIALALSTPAMGRIADPTKQFENIAEFVDKIGDRDCTAPAAKAEVTDTLRQMQAGVIAKIAEACNEMTEEQNALIKDLFETKKS
jgi:hypothetical protein